MKKFLSCFMALSMVLGLSAGMTFSVSADTPAENRDGEETVSLTEFLSDADSDSGDALSELYANFNSGINEDGTSDTSVFDYDENQVSDTMNLLEEQTYPKTFDLRHVGGTITYNTETKKNDITGGTSYVTPVKFQNPWGTCWAFGITAAAETSILYESGQGSTETANTNLDLSEHHLAWFAKTHLPAEDEEDYGTNYVDNQDGEGLYYTGENANDAMASGFPFYGASIFANGEGVVSESVAPYCGKNRSVIVVRNAGADKSLPATKRYASYADWEAEDESIRANYTPLYYLKEDDWSLDESIRFTQEYAIEESNELPSVSPTTDKETGEKVLNTDGINAIKSELSQGRAVNIVFFADTSDPNAVGGSVTRYINENYAHYCWDSTSVSHSVCIVGWDDDYDASNFGQEHPVKYDSANRIIYKLKDSDQELSYTKDGKLYYVNEAGETIIVTDTSLIEPARDEDGSASVPSGNGAWIVKNSWGSSDNEFPNKYTWGIDGSGYFYISYYDTSVQMAESFDFIVTDEEKQENDYAIADQYDYMPAYSTSQSTAIAPVMMANVFTATQDMEIKAVSCETTTPGTTVVYGICLLDEDEDCPAGDDEVISYTDPIEYKYGGYHREELENPVVVAKGQKYAVIAIESYEYTVTKNGEPVIKDGKAVTATKYFICSNSSISESYAASISLKWYAKGVINPGESYILTYGYNTNELMGTDYYTYITNLQKFDSDASLAQYDNFSIKAYASPVTAMYRLYNPNSSEHLYTSSADEVAELTELGWQDEGTAWYAPKTSETPVYRLYNPNSGDHHYTAYTAEVDELVGLGWVNEGIAWYSGGDLVVNRLFNPNATVATHHYTGFETEREGLVELGWQDEGAAWNAIAIPSAVDADGDSTR